MCQNLNCQKHSLKGQSGTKSPVKPTWSEKITVLSSFSKSSLNFLSNNKTKHYKIWYSQKVVLKFELPETQFEIQAERKSPEKPTWSEKMTVLSTFLESSLNFLSNDRKKHYKT